MRLNAASAECSPARRSPSSCAVAIIRPVKLESSGLVKTTADDALTGAFWNVDECPGIAIATSPACANMRVRAAIVSGDAGNPEALLGCTGPFRRVALRRRNLGRAATGRGARDGGHNGDE